MTNQEYVKAALRTNTNIKVKIDHSNEDLIHAVLGISTEAGELLDNVKKHLYYNKPFDALNAKEELGDLLWYVAILSNWLEIDIADIMEANIAKLKVRYPDKFDMTKAVERDLKKEHTALEQKKVEVLDSPHSWVSRGTIGTVTKEFSSTGMIDVMVEGLSPKSEKVNIEIRLFSGQYRYVKS